VAPKQVEEFIKVGALCRKSILVPVGITLKPHLKYKGGKRLAPEKVKN